VTAASTARAEAGLAGTAPAEFRRRLLEGMAAAIRDTGYRDATVADVVRHARTSRRTFYEHFPSKQTGARDGTSRCGRPSRRGSRWPSPTWRSR
jgi:AcrR family transcriptional regulator